jgi:hypothetical protein
MASRQRQDDDRLLNVYSQVYYKLVHGLDWKSAEIKDY